MKRTDKFTTGNKRIKLTLVIALVYFATLLPSQFMLNLLPGTELRISAFVPVVGGILFGYPAAIGVGIGNFACDMIVYGPASAGLTAIGSLLNGLSAIMSYYVFRAFNLNGRLRNAQEHRQVYEFVHDVRSLASYIGTVLITELVLAAGISVVLNMYSGTDISRNMMIVFLSNVEVCMLLGLPAIVFLPRIAKDNRPITYSLRFRTFANLTMASILLSILIAVIVYIMAVKLIDMSGNSELEIVSHLIQANGFIIILLTLVFGMLERSIEKHLTEPLEKVSNILRNDDDKMTSNEIDVLSKRIDFAVKDANRLSGNEYTLYVGLTKSDGSGNYSTSFARDVIGSICLKYVGGYFSNESTVGGYRGEQCDATEQVLVYHIFGATDVQIENICIEVKSELCQESILVEKNKMTRWYV